MTRERVKKITDEINIHRRAHELALRILELKKQRRSVDRSINKVESDLQDLFDQAGIDSLEMDMGLLVRRKTEAGYEWLIEI